MAVHTALGISNRDFIFHRQFRTDFPETGTIILAQKSIDFPGLSFVQNYVRGFI